MRSISIRLAAAVVGAGLALDALLGRAELLVRPWFVPVLAGAGVALALAALRARGHMPLSGFLALLVPIAVGATLTPSVVSAAARGQSTTTASISSRLGDPANPLLAGKGGNVTLLQILLAEQAQGGVVLAGREVTVEGIAAGPHRIERSVIVCCAADAQTISLDEQGAALPRGGTWVRVQGTLTTDGNTTVLEARTITRIDTPADPFL